MRSQGDKSLVSVLWQVDCEWSLGRLFIEALPNICGLP